MNACVCESKGKRTKKQIALHTKKNTNDRAGRKCSGKARAKSEERRARVDPHVCAACDVESLGKNERAKQNGRNSSSRPVRLMMEVLEEKKERSRKKSQAVRWSISS